MLCRLSGDKAAALMGVRVGLRMGWTNIHGGGKNPQLAPLHIDGEPVETAATLEIEIIEKAFKLLMP